MKCPFCLAPDTKVIDSRDFRDGQGTKRRRVCPACQERFSTVESVLVPKVVIKRDDRRVPFDREKLATSIRRACTKESLSQRQIDEMLTRIEADLSRNRIGEVTSNQLGELVLAELKRFDLMAYFRYASVYRGIKDIRAFNELQSENTPV